MLSLYIVTMLDVSSLQKLRRKLTTNPKSVRFNELVRVLSDLGYRKVRSRGSHYVFRPAGAGPSIVLVKPHKGRPFCSQADVERVVELLQMEASDE